MTVSQLANFFTFLCGVSLFAGIMFTAMPQGIKDREKLVEWSVNLWEILGVIVFAMSLNWYVLLLCAIAPFIGLGIRIALNVFDDKFNGW